MSKSRATRPREILVIQVHADPGVQVRGALDEEVVDRYASAMQEGVHFPPIVVAADGKNRFTLIDGAHRIAAWRRVNRSPKIWATVLGRLTLTERFWAAIEKNASHGKALTRVDRELAIKKALMLDAQMSDSAIAKRIGVSNHTVAKFRRDLESTLAIAKVERTIGSDGKSYPVRSATPCNDEPPDVTDCAPPPNGNGDEPSSAPTCEDDQPSAVELLPEVGEDLCDGLGHRITHEKLAEAMRRDCELVRLLTALSQVKMAVLHALDRQDPLYGFVSRTVFQNDITRARAGIETARPYAVCPYCGGDGCKPCHGQGWVNKSTYTMAPKEMPRASPPPARR